LIEPLPQIVVCEVFEPFGLGVDAMRRQVRFADQIVLPQPME
jgi:hypothetical protein